MRHEQRRKCWLSANSSKLKCAVLLLAAAHSSTSELRQLVFDLQATRQKSEEIQTVLPWADDTPNAEFRYNLRNLRSRSKKSIACKLHNFANVQYHMVIEIGRPCRIGVDTQVFRIVPDTGSSDLWIPASNCTACHGVNRFFLNKSCSAKELKRRVSVKYGDGTIASGSAFTDVVIVGKGELEVTKQFLIEVDTMNDAAAETMTVDGILGLGHHYDEGEHADEGRSFVAKLFLEHPRLPRMFSFFLTKTDRLAKLVFGDPDIQRYAKEPFIYGKRHYMEDTNMWLTSVYSIGFANTGVERRFPTSQHVRGAPSLVDSGTTLLVLDPSIWADLMQELRRHLLSCNISYVDGSLMMCECPEDLGAVPELVINVIDEADKEHSLCMASEEYIVRSFAPVTGRSICVPSLQRGNHKQSVPLIFGQAFIQAFYTNFDIEHNRIGFARSIQSPLPAHARCTVHRAVDKTLWIWSVALVSLGVLFAIYTCVCGDVNACCGWPSCKVSEPCCAITKEEQTHLYNVAANPSDQETPRRADQSDSKKTTSERDAFIEAPADARLEPSQEGLSVA